MVPDWAVTDMERVLAVLPDNAEALYFTGLAAAQRVDNVTARERWTTLRDLFAQDSAEYRQAGELIEALP